jgi:single-strand DNA-binding protein
MSAALNQCNLIGNLTRKPEVKYLQSGTAVCDLGLAINERVKRNNEWTDEVTFVDVTLFGRVAEVAGEYLDKGAPVLIVGKLRFEQWEKDGQKRSKLKVVGDSMQMLGGKPRNEDSQERPARREEYSQEPQQSAPPAPDEDSIPF